MTAIAILATLFVTWRIASYVGRCDYNYRRMLATKLF